MCLVSLLNTRQQTFSVYLARRVTDHEHRQEDIDSWYTRKLLLHAHKSVEVGGTSGYLVVLDSSNGVLVNRGYAQP